jgi:hypothetical protein
MRGLRLSVVSFERVQIEIAAHGFSRRRERCGSACGGGFDGFERGCVIRLDVRRVAIEGHLNAFKSAAVAVPMGEPRRPSLGSRFGPTPCSLAKDARLSSWPSRGQSAYTDLVKKPERLGASVLGATVWGWWSIHFGRVDNEAPCPLDEAESTARERRKSSLASCSDRQRVAEMAPHLGRAATRVSHIPERDRSLAAVYQTLATRRQAHLPQMAARIEWDGPPQQVRPGIDLRIHLYAGLHGEGWLTPRRQRSRAGRDGRWNLPFADLAGSELGSNRLGIADGLNRARVRSASARRDVSVSIDVRTVAGTGVGVSLGGGAYADPGAGVGVTCSLTDPQILGDELRNTTAAAAPIGDAKEAAPFCAFEVRLTLVQVERVTATRRCCFACELPNRYRLGAAVVSADDLEPLLAQDQSFATQRGGSARVIRPRCAHSSARSPRTQISSSLAARRALGTRAPNARGVVPPSAAGGGTFERAGSVSSLGIGTTPLLFVQRSWEFWDGSFERVQMKRGAQLIRPTGAIWATVGARSHLYMGGTPMHRSK